MARNWGTGKGYRKHGFYWGKQVNVGNENWQVEKNWRSCTFQFLKHIALFAAPCFSWIGCFPSNHNRLYVVNPLFFFIDAGWGVVVFLGLEWTLHRSYNVIHFFHTYWETPISPTEKKKEKISTRVDDHLYSNFFFKFSCNLMQSIDTRQVIATLELTIYFELLWMIELQKQFLCDLTTEFQN